MLLFSVSEMFDSIRDKFYNFQENFATTLKELSSAKNSTNKKQSYNENVLVNLNAGTDVLSEFQLSWSELHDLSQVNATRAEEVDILIFKTHKKIQKQWKSIGQLTSIFTSLPEIVHSVNVLAEKILILERLFETTEEALTQLKDVVDTRKFQNRQLEQRFQLALYEEKKLAGLEDIRLKLAEELAAKVRRHEVRQQRLLKECQLASEENFKQDMKLYKETNMIPKIEFAKSKNSNNSEGECNTLEDITLDTEDTSALDEFLNESNDSERDNLQL